MPSGSSPKSSKSQRVSDPIDSQSDDQAFDFELSLDEIDQDVSQVKDTQFAEMEIDTQPTESYDRRELPSTQQTAADRKSTRLNSSHWE